MASLQEQLLKAGLSDEKKAKKIKKEKRKQPKKAKGAADVSESKQQAEQALAEKRAHAQALNKKQRAETEKKEIQAQIIQLIKTNSIARSGELAYQFKDGVKIKKLYINEKLQTQLSKGQLAIARLGEGYELVPAKIAAKIQQRDETAILLLNDNATEEVDEDDPYADFQIPDDLMW